ncbi:MAG: flagellar basal body P-ring protein FlgI [Candidatus Riflebacteria bacterium]|nr:flagellar basal body P-ring protein FlgI [Candidatus Riflebacteria bacterium]
MYKCLIIVIVFFVFLIPNMLFSEAMVRIKDIASLSGQREYQLVGYGLVTGLNGTGDKSQMSLDMVRGMLRNMGMEIDKTSIQSKNCAAVVVTAMLPPFGRSGESFDVTVSSIGDAKSLQGGVLLPVLLKGGDAQVYAVTQGPVSIGGFPDSGGGGAGGQKNHLTVGTITRGAILEREVGDRFGEDGTFRLVLQKKDPILSRRVRDVIARKFGEHWAHIDDPGSVQIKIPSAFKNDPVSFAAAIEGLELTVEEPNRVVINERTGTVIFGSKVRVSPITISQGSLRIEVALPNAPKPKPGAKGGNAAPDTVKGSLINLSGETTVDDLVKALNMVGAAPKDLIAIFQAIDAAGALHGELKLM